MRLAAIGLMGVAVFPSTTPASAHHSFAMFDYMKSMTLEGTVKEFQWTNPRGGRGISITLPDGVMKKHPYPLGIRTS